MLFGEEQTGIVEGEVKDHFLAHEIEQFYTRNTEATFISAV